MALVLLVMLMTPMMGMELDTEMAIRGAERRRGRGRGNDVGQEKWEKRPKREGQGRHPKGGTVSQTKDYAGRGKPSLPT